MVRITEDQAHHWEVTRRYDDSLDPYDREARKELYTNPSIEQLVGHYRQLKGKVEVIERNMREIAVTLMSDPYISTSKLARELGVSRQTLYTWHEEAHPNLRKRDDDHDDDFV